MPLVSIKRFAYLIEAELACNLLRQSGINYVLQKDGIPGAASFIQGADLLVEEKDAKDSRRILGEKE